MYVRDALADNLVQRQESPISAKGLCLGCRYPSPGAKQRSEQRPWELGQGGVVLPRDYQGVAVEDGANVQEGHHFGFVEHEMAGNVPADDLVKDATCHGQDSRPAHPWAGLRLAGRRRLRLGRQDGLVVPAPVSLLRMSNVPLGTAPPETVLPEPPSEAQQALAEALAIAEAGPKQWAAVSAVAARWPRYLAAWATLAELADGPVAGYAYARTGYHRGLDALRAAGWRGSGYVRWRYLTNRGFLRCLDALRQRAGEIGEGDEEQRCGLFLLQLDPDWERTER